MKHATLFKLSVLITIFTLLFSFESRATHMIGGEISYRCMGSNIFELKMTLYQSCLANTGPARDADYPIQYTVYENSPIPTLVQFGNITLANIDIESMPHGFSNECISNIPTVCMQRSVGTTNLVLPPSEYGYTVVYQRCCRNLDILNLVESGNLGVTYSATIPPFENNECPNNSPEFKNMPPQIICSSFPFIYDYSATDIDGDSLVYRLCESYLGASMTNPIPEGGAITPPPFVPAPYFTGFSATNPMPGFPPMNLDPESGILTATPTATGRYQVKVCIEEYRDGVLLNVHSRDLQFEVTNCSKLVFADIPSRTDDPNVFKVECQSYTVAFENTSEGGMTYHWDFGDGSPESELFEPVHTYPDTGTYEVKLVINRGTTCADSIVKLVKIYPYFVGDFSFDGSFCPGTPVFFFDSLEATFGFDYEVRWEFGNGDEAFGSNPEYTFDSSGIYNVTMYAKTELGCELSISKAVNIIDFKPNAGNDTIIVLGYDFYLNATGGDNYFWSPPDYLSDPFIANPQVVYPDTGYYSYTVSISKGEACNNLDTINILVVEKPALLLPNAFSPNGDGVNDVFKPVIVGFPYAEFLRIYDRWGDLVYQGYRADMGWDGTSHGKPAEIGVYFFEFSAKNIHGESEYVKGDLTLLR